MNIIEKLAQEFSVKISQVENTVQLIDEGNTIPFIARYIGFLPTIGPGGATTMDSTLPIITKYTNPATSTIAFFNGFVTGALPPILIPFFLKMAGY